MLTNNWDVVSITEGRSGGIGRHKGLKIPCSQGRAGSSPAFGTNLLYCIYLISYQYVTLTKTYYTVPP